MTQIFGHQEPSLDWSDTDAEYDAQIDERIKRKPFRLKSAYMEQRQAAFALIVTAALFISAAAIIGALFGPETAQMQEVDRVFAY
jgi:hypothetical protein